MNRPGERTDGENLEPIERLLERFRPVGPPARLRARALAAAESVLTERRPRRIGVYVWRAAVAAGLIVAVCLNLAAERISTSTLEQVGIGPAIWTQQTEQIAQMLDGEGSGGRYLAMALQAGPLGDSPLLPRAGLDAEKPY